MYPLFLRPSARHRGRARTPSRQAGISTGKMLAHSPAAEPHRAGDPGHSLPVA